MSQKIKNAGFSMIEAMVACLVTSITFVGVYSLTAFASTSLKNSIDRQKMQLVANEILETINSDISNIDSYNNMSFTTCVDNQDSSVKEISRYKWCRMLNDYVGTSAAGDTRKVTITTVADGKNLSIILESRNKKAQIVIKRFYEQ